MSSAEFASNPGKAAAAWLEYADELRYFVLGVTRDVDLTGEVLQNTFAKAIEQAGAVERKSLKAWLFRVAYNEAMLHHRRRNTRERAVRRIAEGNSAWRLPEGEAAPEAGVARWETVAAVREALLELPEEQQEVVRLRIYDQKKFAEIAERLDLPLGTVLSRMQLALKKLRRALREHS